MKTLGLVVLVSAPAFAAGFAIDAQSARAEGMGTAVTSQIDDASAIYYNPAGIVRGQHVDVQLGDTLISPSVAVTPTGGTETQTQSSLAPPPHFYATYGITDAVTLGVGVFTPFGAKLKWPSDWQGRQLSLSSDLATYTINPEAGFKLGERLRIGGGLQIVRGTVDLSQGTNFVDKTGTVELGGGAWGMGFNFGAQASPMEHLWVGVTYRTDVTLNFAGRAHFSDVPPELASTLKDQNVTTTFRLPEVATFGVSYVAMEKLTVAFDVDYYAWSRLQTIDLRFDDPQLNQSLTKNWNDTFNFHIGAEYAISDALRARLGFVYDPTPSPAETLTPDLPDATRMQLAAGLGYSMSGFAVNLGYQYVILSSITSTSPFFPGTYRGSANVVGLTLSYRN